MIGHKLAADAAKQLDGAGERRHGLSFNEKDFTVHLAQVIVVNHSYRIKPGHKNLSDVTVTIALATKFLENHNLLALR